MYTILFVEDNPHIMNINLNAFIIRGYDVRQATTVAECKQVLESQKIDLIVMDVMLPDGNGVEVCTQLKKQYEIPVVFLSALGENQDVIAGLKAGGDDYLAKPYDLEVLLARVEARLRSSYTAKRFVDYGALRLDTMSLCGYLNGEDMLLTQKEFLVLLALAKNAQSAISKEQLYREVWGSTISGDSQALYTTMSRVKKT